MKKLLYSMVALMVVSVSACNETFIDDLNGKYPPAVDYTLTTLDDQASVKLGGGLRQISLSLSGGGATFAVDFVTNDYFLKPGTYTPGEAQSPSNGAWLTGSTEFNGIAVTAGSINVARSDESAYTVSGTLGLADASFVNIDWAGTIVFTADPPEITYSWEDAGQYFYTPDGQNYLPVDGSQLNKVTVHADGVLKAYFEIVTEAGTTSLAGSYPVSGSITDTSGAVVGGTYVDLPALGWGTEIVKGGSYLMDNGVEQFLLGGTLTITADEETLSFSSGDFTILDITSPFYAPVALPGTVGLDLKNGTSLAPAEPMTYTVETSTPYSYTQDGINFTNVDGTTVHKVTVLQGAQTLAYFELVSATDAPVAGTYTLADPVSGPDQAVVGSYMDMAWFGMDSMVIESGSYYVSGGAKQFIRAGEGVTLSVTDAGGVLSISGSNLPIQDVSQPMWVLLPDQGSVNFTGLQPEQ